MLLFVFVFFFPTQPGRVACACEVGKRRDDPEFGCDVTSCSHSACILTEGLSVYIVVLHKPRPIPVEGKKARNLNIPVGVIGSPRASAFLPADEPSRSDVRETKHAAEAGVA